MNTIDKETLRAAALMFREQAEVERRKIVMHDLTQERLDAARKLVAELEQRRSEIFANAAALELKAAEIEAAIATPEGA